MVQSSSAASPGTARFAALRTVLTLPLLALVLASLIFAATFGSLVEEVREHDTRATDQSILRAIDDHTASVPVAAANIASYPGEEVVVGAVGLVLTLALLLRRRWLDALLAAGTVGGYAVLTYGIKHFVQRQRPIAFFRVPESGYGFPSGHTMGATCLAFAFGFLLWRSGLHRRWRVGALFLLAVVVVVVGLSRLILGVHYPTDVLGSLLLGIAWMSGLIAARSGIERWIAHRRPHTQPYTP